MLVIGEKVSGSGYAQTDPESVVDLPSDDWPFHTS
jgi:hypothetical protein